MPVTARLSGKFYERFGDEIANELVEWFNAVDSTYQTQLKETNDLNWARMEARFDVFESRMDAFEARIEARFQKFRSEMLLWMFAFWSATVIPLIGVMLALSGTFRG
ncbi:MAG: hypothetical protein M3O61_04280 [Gemmatimonadota bacterium]|nr:hypothetical protein [Gemmatimonadota bacterium]